MKRAITKRDILVTYADRWRSLAAWGAVLPMTIEIRDGSKMYETTPLGKARPSRCFAYVYDDGDLVRNLKTILHEMAHLAAPTYEHHGQAWRQMFARGAAEALGARVEDFDLDVALFDLNNQVQDAVCAWLDRSGQGAVLKAIGVL